MPKPKLPKLGKYVCADPTFVPTLTKGEVDSTGFPQMQMYEPHKEDVRDYIAHFRVASPHTRTRLVAPVPPSALQQENLQTVYFKAADADDDCELINLPPSSSHQSQSKPQQPAGQQSHVLAPHASPSTPVETIEQNDKQLKTLDPSFFALFRHASTLPPKPWMGGAFGEDSVYSAATASTVASTSRVMTNNQGTKSRPFLHSQSQANLFPSSPSAGQQSMRMTSSASSPFLVGAQGGRGTSRQGGGTGRAASPPPGERARSPPRFSQTHSGSWRQQGGMEGGGDASANRTNRLTATPSVLGFGCQTPRWNGEEVYKGCFSEMYDIVKDNFDHVRPSPVLSLRATEPRGFVGKNFLGCPLNHESPPCGHYDVETIGTLETPPILSHQKTPPRTLLPANYVAMRLAGIRVPKTAPAKGPSGPKRDSVPGPGAYNHMDKWLLRHSQTSFHRQRHVEKSRFSLKALALDRSESAAAFTRQQKGSAASREGRRPGRKAVWT